MNNDKFAAAVLTAAFCLVCGVRAEAFWSGDGRGGGALEQIGLSAGAEAPEFAAPEAAHRILMFEEALYRTDPVTGVRVHDCGKLKLDTDGDGRVGGGHYLAFDWDKDGKIGPNEFCRSFVMNDLKSLDADASGTLERGELQRARAYLLLAGETYFEAADLGGVALDSLEIGGLTAVLRPLPAAAESGTSIYSAEFFDEWGQGAESIPQALRARGIKVIDAVLHGNVTAVRYEASRELVNKAGTKGEYGPGDGAGLAAEAKLIREQLRKAGKTVIWTGRWGDMVDGATVYYLD